MLRLPAIAALMLTAAAGAVQAHDAWPVIASGSESTTLRVPAQVERARRLYALGREWVFGSLPRQTAESLSVLLDGVDGPSDYAPGDRLIRIGSSAPADDLAHETGHALVHLLKPGFRIGAARVIHEALADMTAVLLAYRQRDTASIVLRETGGDLRRESAATRIGGPRCRRSARSPLTLQLVGFDRARVTLSVLEVPGTLSDPYYVSGVLTGALHDVFCSVYEQRRRVFADPVDAVAASADLTGSLMFRALLYVGEHRVSLRDYAAALVRADRNHFASRFRGVLEEVLLARGFFSSSDELRAVSTGQAVPPARLDPAERDPSRIMAWTMDLEGRLLDRVRSVPAGRVLEQFRLPLFFHRNTFPHPRFVDLGTVALESDLPTPDGYRLVRLRYLCPLDLTTQQAYETMHGGSAKAVRDSELPEEAFAALLFDPEGRLVDVHTDRPMPAILHGYL